MAAGYINPHVSLLMNAMLNYAYAVMSARNHKTPRGEVPHFPEQSRC
jgi:hypothetical protein